MRSGNLSFNLEPLTNGGKMGFFSSLKMGGRSLAYGASAVAVTALTTFSSFAEGEQTNLIPDTGIDLTAYVNEAITTLAGVVAVVVGGIIAFMLIRAGIRWIRSLK